MTDAKKGSAMTKEEMRWMLRDMFAGGSTTYEEWLAGTRGGAEAKDGEDKLSIGNGGKTSASNNSSERAVGPESKSQLAFDNKNEEHRVESLAGSIEVGERRRSGHSNGSAGVAKPPMEGKSWELKSGGVESSNPRPAHDVRVDSGELRDTVPLGPMHRDHPSAEFEVKLKLIPETCIFTCAFAVFTLVCALL